MDLRRFVSKTFAWLFLFAAVGSGPLAATVIQVSTVSDAIATDNRCTLREAVIAANTDTQVDTCPAGSGADTIVLFFTSDHVIDQAGIDEDMSLTGDFDIRSDVTIRPQDPGAFVTIDAQGMDRVFEVFDGADLTLERIEVRGGDVAGFGGGIFVQDVASELRLVDSAVVSNEATLFGGGIFSRGPVWLERSLVRLNEASTGGGIYISTVAPLTLLESEIQANLSASDGGGANVVVLDAVRSTFSFNDADRNGGGVFWRNGGGASDSSRMINSTVADNRSGDSGGGLYFEAPGELELYNATIAWNEADTDDNGTGDGGGVFVATGSVRIESSILAGNIDVSGGTQAPDCAGTLESGGYNLVAAVNGGECFLTGDGTGNLVGTVAAPVVHELDCIDFNGGPTRTVALLDTSPAIDAADPNGCTDGDGGIQLFDQRGYQRPWDGPDADQVARCDMGAYEFDAPSFVGIFADGFESGDTTAWGGGGRYSQPTFGAPIWTQGLEEADLWRLGFLGGGCGEPE